ncbi:NrtA/SsuA/CpmA family ABC transporter substrate-binding protein [Rhodohalobacter sp. WB101]|uniref:NrtA/SsuA/CpmA family ABC transporter substrate-binding protein n=2 Tax=Rhodohalobacter sulfatireducens TaxID=2911366 RepID=A0ABS9KGB2_9BACT|nr:NrtA/SsuA/CpmA family ABC transporter substrate-binding protein [Rhodohalobacter sulfatireducens]
MSSTKKSNHLLKMIASRSVQKSFRIELYAVLFCCMLTGCYQSESGQHEELQEVAIGVTSTYQGEAATYIAKERGFFELNGLNVTLKENPSGKISMRDLIDGVVQIAHVAETPVIYSIMDTSYFKGSGHPPFQIFADKIYSHDIQKIIGRRDHGITEAEDIVGKKVAIYQGTQLDYFFDSFLLEHQILNSEIEIVNMSPEKQIEAIKNGEIDVSVTWEPYSSYIQKELGENAVHIDTDLTYSTLWLSVALNSYASSHPDILAAYLESIKMAQDYIRENPSDAQEILARKTNVPLDVIESLWTEIDFELSLSERMLTLLEDQARWMIRNDLADTTIQNMEELINFGPMEQVHPIGITVVR